MSRTKKERLELVVFRLAELNRFSSEQAREFCSEVRPGYLTRTLKQLVRDGLLCEMKLGDEIWFHWQASAGCRDLHRHWIERQLTAPPRRCTPTSQSRRRLFQSDPSDLATEDLLAILIQCGVEGESVEIGAQKIALHFDDRLGELRRCTASQLRAVTPVANERSYCQIMAGIELGLRVVQAHQQSRTTSRITSTRDAIDYCRGHFFRLALEALQEEFHIVTLDTKHKPITSHRITVGTLDTSLVHPREVFRPAIRDAAAAVLLVHNHPSGDPTPSREDHKVTQQMTHAGELLGIHVLDHIVVASEDCVSLREIG